MKLAATTAFLATIGAGAALGADPVPTPIGVGPLYRPLPTGARAAAGLPIAGLRCTRARGPRFGVHIELFARGRVVIVPAGIGLARPQLRRGAFVAAGRCAYAARSRAPTGVIEIRADVRLRLGQLFDIWSQPLSRARLAGFRAAPHQRVRGFVGGREWRGDLRRIPLRRHAQIVLELGTLVPPHPRFLFPRGL